MESPFAISIAKNGADQGRIGPNQRSSISDSTVAIEAAVKELAPLPTTFDVQPIQPPYFQEFTYYDLFGGVLVMPMSPEVAARVIDKAVASATPDYAQVDLCLSRLEDKYALATELSSPQARRIVFMPGGNLAYSVDRSKLDEVLFNDPQVLIKPHPVTNDDYVRHLGTSFGYGRMIPPKESGMGYLFQAEKVWTGANSEIGLVCAMRRQWFDQITNVANMPRMTYAPIYRLFRTGDIEHNYEVMARLFGAADAGLVMPWQDVRAKLQAFFARAMHEREFFFPSYPGLMFAQPKG